MAEAAAQAASLESTTQLKLAETATPADLLGTDGYTFCAPETLAALCGPVLGFFDRCDYTVLGRIEGRPHTRMVCEGSDRANAARQTARIATGSRLREVQPPLIIWTNAKTADAILAEKKIPRTQPARCHEFGAALAAGISTGIL